MKGDDDDKSVQCNCGRDAGWTNKCRPGHLASTARGAARTGSLPAAKNWSLCVVLVWTKARQQLGSRPFKWWTGGSATRTRCSVSSSVPGNQARQLDQCAHSRIEHRTSPISNLMGRCGGCLWFTPRIQWDEGCDFDVIVCDIYQCIRNKLRPQQSKGKFNVNLAWWCRNPFWVQLGCAQSCKAYCVDLLTSASDFFFICKFIQICTIIVNSKLQQLFAPVYNSNYWSYLTPLRRRSRIT